MMVRWLVWVLVLLLYLAAFRDLAKTVQQQVPDDPRCSWSALLSDTAHRPYIHRTLVPSVVRGLVAITPYWVRQRLEGPAARVAGNLEDSPEKTFDLAVAFAVAMGCLLAFVFVLVLLLDEAYEYPAWVPWLAPFGVLMMLRLDMWYWFYIYDSATLLLSALMILFLMRAQLVPYFAVYSLALLNKETAVFAIGAYVAFQLGRQSKRRVALGVAAQVAVFALIKAALTYRFSGSPGGMVEWQIQNNFAFLSTITVRSVFFYFLSLLYAGLVFSHWSSKPMVLRHAFVFQLAPLVALSLIWGHLQELRIYYDVLPLVFLLSVPTVVGALGIVDSPYRLRRA